MTTPVTTDDIVQGCVKFLKAQTDIQAVVGSFDDDTPWIFQDKPLVTIERTSSVAVVVWYAGGWAGPNTHNTMRFPRVAIDLYADPQRDSSGNATRLAETRTRINAAYQVLDRHLHMAGGGQQMWGTVRVCGSTRLSEPIIYEVDNTDGVLRLQVFYGAEEG